MQLDCPPHIFLCRFNINTTRSTTTHNMLAILENDNIMISVFKHMLFAVLAVCYSIGLLFLGISIAKLTKVDIMVLVTMLVGFLIGAVLLLWADMRYSSNRKKEMNNKYGPIG